ncbi:MAG: phospholipase D-like domain-containing protein [Candidatus Hydrogenedentota bacterium]
MKNRLVFLLSVISLVVGCLYERIIVVPSEVNLEDPAFYQTISGISRTAILEGNDAQIINSGKETYKLICSLLENAQYSINIESYIYHDDEIGRKIAEILCRKSKSGVKINLIIDSFGARHLGGEIPALLKKAGVRLYFYHPIELGRFIRYINRTHRKLIIVDGKIGISGGFGISSHWLSEDESKNWYDIQVVIKGPSVFQMQSIFMEHWLELTGEVLTGPEYFPTLQKQGDVSLRIVGSSPRNGSSAIQHIYLFALNSARKNFFMENAYFVPDDLSVKSFIEAAKRGVDVRIIVPGLSATDAKAPIYAGRTYYGELLKNGVKIYEYKKQKLHSKFATADGLWTTIGSTNFDNRSFKLNEELNVNIYDKNFAEKMGQIFEKDLKDCEALDAKKFRRRPLTAKLKEYLYKLFEEQF